MASNISKRVQKLEEELTIGLEPNALERLYILQALMTKEYVSGISEHDSDFGDSVRLLKDWKKKMGSSKYYAYIKSLRETKTTRPEHNTSFEISANLLKRAQQKARAQKQVE